MAVFVNKWSVIFLVPAVLYMASLPHKVQEREPIVHELPHPLHVSVTEINHNATDRTLEISCKLFTDDFEKILSDLYKTKVDLVNPVNRAETDKLVSDFVQKHLLLKVNGKPVTAGYLGFERDKDAVYSYLQVDDIPALSKLEIVNSLMYEMYTDQINLVHTMVGGKRKSIKLDYPEKKAEFTY